MDSMLSHICELLASMNGTRIILAKAWDQGFRIEFTVTNALSRLMINYLAEASNVKLNTFAKYSPSSHEAIANPDEALIYRFIGSKNEIRFLGAHLTWMLYKSGVITQEIEQKYCNIFGAKNRSA